MRAGSAFDPAAYARLIERQDEAWVHSRLELLPRHWRGKVKREFSPRYAAGKWEANAWLRELTEPLEAFRLPVTLSDYDIRDWARSMASSFMDAAGLYPSIEAARVVLNKRVRTWGITPPDEKIADAGAVARMTSEYWLRRKLRKVLGRTLEQVAIGAGLVHRFAGLYVSEDTYQRRQQQKQRNAETLESLEVANEEGDAYGLAAIARHSIANPRIRRGEVMARIRGFEEVSRLAGHSAVFITLTCPSRFHARKLTASNIVVENPRYDGSTPGQAQKYLCRVWARIRAKLKRDSIQIYGFRVAEPHHDATPHWHMLFFLEPDHEQAFEQIVRHYALADSPDEPGAQERRVEWVKIDSSKGTAAGYIAKYISKNLDAHQVAEDFEGCDGVTGAKRVEAWASTWGIRQFQQIGGPPVSVWRELRRLRNQPVNCPVAEPIRYAADKGDWATFTKGMGGPLALRRDRPLSLRYRTRYRNGPSGTGTGTVTGTEPLTDRNAYGEPTGPRITGVWVRGTGETIETRPHRWSIRRARTQSAAPWTRVNNCTPTPGRPISANGVMPCRNGVTRYSLPYYSTAITLFPPDQAEIDACTPWPPPSWPDSDSMQPSSPPCGP
ncbi:MAG TPA: replication endonuclease [Thiobacillaceae bacterium]|nr:replication endonuclease [Thiobacillaceae bacterium]HNA82216.1 replication endonuclease [Thiobacillaceae bacterium]HNG03287.1 replication endonuclease [Nitrospira sp.]HNI07600.1 replication endonuclease [Thiobacillaceae bacterium]